MTSDAFEIIGAAHKSRWLLTCDHASNRVPDDVCDGSLGLPAADMGRHIAYDVGAEGVTRHLSRLLGAPAILSRFSRLVIDPNRGEDDPTILMKLYDGSVIPGNQFADEVELNRRKRLYYTPYHDAVADLAARQPDTIVVAVHSFTPRLNGRAARPWHIGVLFAHDTRFSAPLVETLKAEPDLCIGENEPYAGYLPGDSIDRHALQAGRANALIELRHDLIETEADQRAWAERLAPMLEAALATSQL